jgi:hypothetical protein
VKVIPDVSGDGYSRNVPGEGYSRNVSGEGYSRNVPGEGYSRRFTAFDYPLGIFRLFLRREIGSFDRISDHHFLNFLFMAKLIGINNCLIRCISSIK